MFQKHLRLRGQKNIASVLRGGVQFLGRYFKVVSLQHPQENPLKCRVAVVAGVKLFKSSVKRNLLKRISREVVMRSLEDVSGHDIIVYPAARALSAKFSALVTDFSHIAHALKGRHTHH